MLSVKTHLNYSKVVCNDYLKKGDVILCIKGVLKPFPNRFSIQIDEENHLHPYTEDELSMKNLIWPYLNHSCEPNVYVDVISLQLIALRDIQPNEEIAFDYEQTELAMKEPFACNCGNVSCRKLISGKKISGVLRSN